MTGTTIPARKVYGTTEHCNIVLNNTHIYITALPIKDVHTLNVLSQYYQQQVLYIFSFYLLSLEAYCFGAVST